MKRKLFKTVFIKYVLIMTAIVTVCFSATAILISSIIMNKLSESLEIEIKRTTIAENEIIMQALPKYIDEATEFAAYIDNNKDKITALLKTINGNDGVFSIITDTNGNIIYVSNEGYRSKLQIEVLPSSALKSVIAKGEYSDNDLYNDNYMYGIPIKNTSKNTVIGMFFLITPTLTTDNAIKSVKSSLIISCISVMIATIIAAYFITDRILQPISNISKAAQAFASGDFTVRVPAINNDEVGELAVTFNNMAASLESMDKTKATFLANVSHDLRTPMTTISGFIDGILDGTVPPDKVEYYLNIIQSEVKRLSRLVSTLLDISRIQAGERKFNMTSFDICEMTRQILITFESLIDEKRLNVSFECEQDRMYVKADMDAIHQVIYNLCDNAVKFSKEGGRLAITIRERDKRAYVTVYNEGNGIAQEDLPFVFDRFYKADRSRGLDKKGVGLGLFICKTIMEAHGEDIKVDSKQGRYCQFMIMVKRDYNR